MIAPLRTATLARDMGVSRFTLGSWLRGDRLMPPERRKQLGDILIQKGVFMANVVAGMLSQEADQLERATKRNRGVAAKASRVLR